MTLTDRQAYDHYHACYNNASYRTMQAHVVRDLTHAEPTVDWAILKQDHILSVNNAVTDAALAICGVHAYSTALQSLILKMLYHKLSEDTVTVIATYLRLFERDGDTHVDDFLATVITLQQTHIVSGGIQEAIARASQIHSPTGRTAYDLLSAIGLFVRSAEILLTEGDTDYCCEKFEAGVQQLTYVQKKLGE